MSDQDIISLYIINTISRRQVMRVEKNLNLGDYKLIHYQILQTNITRTVWQTLRRITNEILGVKRLRVGGYIWQQGMKLQGLPGQFVFSIFTSTCSLI